nr:VanZ family protein [Govania unica]
MAYGALAFCLMGATLRRDGILPAVLASAFAFAVCLGFSCLMEFAQTYLPARSVSANDIAAGCMGALTAIVTWFVLGPSLLEFGARIARGGVAALMAGASLYAIVYAVIMFFPFDIVFSFADLREMMAAGKSFLGAETSNAGLARGSVRVVMEIALAAPLGVLLLRRPAIVAVVVALCVGFGVEIIQFGLVTGQSTAFAGVTRSLGVFLGWVAARALLRLDHMPVLGDRSRLMLRLGAALALVPFALLVVLLDRWTAGTRPGFDQALAILGAVNWLPFYYFYSGDEVVAAVSAMSQIAQYLPLGVLIWIIYGRGGGRSLWTAGVLSLLLTALVETGGLFVAGYRPDPTNLLLNLIGALGGVWFAGGAHYWLGRIFSGRATEHDLAPRAKSAPGWSLSALAAVLLMVAALLLLFDYPVANGWLLGGLLAYALLLRAHPLAWLVIIPAALPVLDFTVLTGRAMLDPFDALLLVTLAMELWRKPLRLGDFGWRGAFLWLMLAYLAAYVIAVLNGLLPLPPFDANSFSSPYSSWQTLWASKGLLAAILLAPMLWRAVRDNPGAFLLLGYGMASGLLLSGLVVMWERFLFTGLLNFNTEYRAVGPFGTMRTGGAHLDAYLATALPFSAVIFLMHRNLKGMIGALLLALIGLYGTYVTFSRGPYLAVLAAALVLGLGLWLAVRKREGHALRFLTFVLVGVGLAAAAAVPFFNGSFLAKRFETMSEDSGIRWNHWQHVLDLRDGDAASLLFGMGPGRYPAFYYAKDSSKTPVGSVSLGQEGARSFVRLAAGKPVYFSQFVRVQPAHHYTLSYRVRAYGENAALAVPICEKWVADSFGCKWTSTAIADGTGQWSAVSLPLKSGDLASARGRAGWITSRPVKFTLYNPVAKTVVDVTDIKLSTESGRNLVDNGDFSDGLDFWYMTADDPLPWHMDNLFVAGLFEQGYLGLALFLGLVTVVGVRLIGEVLEGDRLSAVFLAAFTGFLVVGVIGSPLDSPRLGLLFYLLLFAAYYLCELMRRERRAALA